MKSITVITNESRHQKIKIRCLKMKDWRRKTKIKDLLNFNKIQVEKLVC